MRVIGGRFEGEVEEVRRRREGGGEAEGSEVGKGRSATAWRLGVICACI